MIGVGKMIKLRKVDKQDARFLYNMLKERDDTINISHRSMPTWEDHLEFVESEPYSVWYIIVYKGVDIGQTYKTHLGEIGIHIKPGYHGKGIGTEAVKRMCKELPERNLANINPKNEKSIRLFEKLGFKLIQYTYELR